VRLQRTQPPGFLNEYQPTDAKAIINLNNPDWQAVLDKLYGTPDDGLLDGTRNFDLRAEDLVLTGTQGDFFTSLDSPQNLPALIGVLDLPNSKIRLEGTIDGEPFSLKLAGRELKIEGLDLTAEEREALVAQLNTIPGLREMKIEATVDGLTTVTKVQGGHEKYEIRNNGRPERPGKPEIEHHGRRLGHERIERLGRIEKPERPERLERGAPGRR
jgi:hypothetical protein